MFTFDVFHIRFSMFGFQFSMFVFLFSMFRFRFSIFYFVHSVSGLLFGFLFSFRCRFAVFGLIGFDFLLREAFVVRSRCSALCFQVDLFGFDSRISDRVFVSRASISVSVSVFEGSVRLDGFRFMR